MSETLTETTQWGYLKTENWCYVGVDTLQEQTLKKTLKRGYEFNILLVGKSGLGKSTLLNSLFKAFVSRKSCSKDDKDLGVDGYRKTTEIKSVTHLLEEKGVRLRLTVTDTPGFGDQINNENCWLPIQEYIYEQYEKYLEEEECIARKKVITDTRVHCCVYFITPSGRWLTSLDIELMKRLCRIVNVIPVIAKSDTMTIEERLAFKKVIRDCLEENGIVVYPMKEIDEDQDDKVLNDRIRDKIPFAVVGSEKQQEINGKIVYGRMTRWGFVDIENKEYCEFSDFRDMLIKTHMIDMIEITGSYFYEKFRRDILNSRKMKDVNAKQLEDKIANDKSRFNKVRASRTSTNKSIEFAKGRSHDIESIENASKTGSVGQIQAKETTDFPSRQSAAAVEPLSKQVSDDKKPDIQNLPQENINELENRSDDIPDDENR